MTAPYEPGDRVIHTASGVRATVVKTILAAVNPDYYTVVLRFDGEPFRVRSLDESDGTVSYGEWAVRRLDVIEQIGELTEKGRTST